MLPIVPGFAPGVQSPNVIKPVHGISGEAAEEKKGMRGGGGREGAEEVCPAARGVLLPRDDQVAEPWAGPRGQNADGAARSRVPADQAAPSPRPLREPATDARLHSAG